MVRKADCLRDCVGDVCEGCRKYIPVAFSGNHMGIIYNEDCFETFKRIEKYLLKFIPKDLTNATK